MPNTTVLNGYLGLGSNMGDAVGNLHLALERLACVPGMEVEAVSPIFRTDPQGVRDQDWFANCVARVRVSLSPEALLDAIAAVEEELGRVRTLRWGPRIIDIDILLLGDIEFNSERLRIPHPHMCERAFVLVPLMMLAPDLLIGGLRPSQWLSRIPHRVEGDRILQPEPIRGE